MFSGIFQPLHLLIILVIVMIIFGAGKLSEIGGGLGKSIKAFRDGLSGESKDEAPIDTKNNIEPK